MTVVVLGSTGLLGNTLAAHYDVVALPRGICDLTDHVSISTMFGWYRPEIVINAAGVVPKAHVSDLQTLRTNALGPQVLREACNEYGARLIHISTNCVFAGQSGGYLEDSIPYPLDMYGMSKCLGEVTESPHLTVRTSFIGLPDLGGRGLLAWASRQKVVIGYDKVKWNGLTTNELGSIIFNTLIPDKVSGILHLHSQVTTKYDVLVTAKDVLGWDTQVIKESEVEELENNHVEDFTLSSSYPHLQTQKSLREMLEEMKKENEL